MRTPLTPTYLPNRTLTLELFDQGDDFLISLHLAKLGQQKLDQECAWVSLAREHGSSRCSAPLGALPARRAHSWR